MKRLIISFFVGASAIAVALSAANRLGPGPTVERAPAEVDGEPADALVTAVEPIDIASLGVELQVDTTRAPLPVVIDQFRDRVATAPQDHLSQITLAATLVQHARETGDPSAYIEAETAADLALQLAPTSVDAQVVKATAEAARHDFTAARDRIEIVLADHPDNVSALAAFGDAHLELGDYEAAEDTYNQLLAVNRSAPAVSRLARLAFVTGDPDRAVDLSIEALVRAADLPLRAGDAAFYWFQLGHHLYEGGDVDGAARALERALTIDAAHAGALELQAMARTAQGRHGDAIAIYQELVADGGAADLHGRLATLLRIEGEEVEADTHTRIGLEVAAMTADTNPAERRHLVGFLVDHDPETALRLAEDDLTTRQDVYAYDAVAWSLWANGRPEDAYDTMQQALSAGTRDADLFFHAGVIAAANGRDDEARGLLGDALRINPAFDPVGAPLAETIIAELAG